MVEIGECIILEEREYLCFNQAELDGQSYIFLVTAEEPTEIRFAKQAVIDGKLQIQVIGNRAEKLKLAAILQEQTAAATTEDTQAS